MGRSKKNTGFFVRKTNCQKAKEYLKKLHLDTNRVQNSAFSNNPLVNNYLQTASNDLKAAQAVFLVEIYPQAIFNLQQSIEKTTKAYALFNGYIDEEASRLLSHDLTCIFDIIHTTALEHWNTHNNYFIENSKQNLYYFAGHEDNLRKTIEDLEFFRLELMRQKEVTKKYSLSIEEINEYLTVLDQCVIDWNVVLRSAKDAMPGFKEFMKQYFALISSPEKMKDFIIQNTKNEMINNIICTSEHPDNNDRILTDIDNFTQGFQDLSDFEQEQMKYIAQKKIPEVFLSGLALNMLDQALIIRLLNLTIPISRHATLSRYPKNGGSFNPNDFYSVENPLITLFPQIAHHTELTIRYLETFLEEMSEFQKNGSLQFDDIA